MTLKSIAKTCEKYQQSYIAQNVIHHFLERYNYGHSYQQGNSAGSDMAEALGQTSVVQAITSHAYHPQKNDEWDYEYVNSAKKLEETIALNFCRVVRWTSGSENKIVAVRSIADLVKKYKQEVFGKLYEESLESCKHIYFFDKTKDERDEKRNPADYKRLKAVGEKIEFDPQKVEELWKKNAKREEVKSWKKTAKNGALKKYSKIMVTVIDSVGRTAYLTRSSQQIRETASALALPEVTVFLGRCYYSAMIELFPRLITAAARSNDIKYLQERVPELLNEINERWKEAEKNLFGED